MSLKQCERVCILRTYTLYILKDGNLCNNTDAMQFTEMFPEKRKYSTVRHLLGFQGAPYECSLFFFFVPVSSS